jgi:hypothetical protein
MPAIGGWVGPRPYLDIVQDITLFPVLAYEAWLIQPLA